MKINVEIGVGVAQRLINEHIAEAKEGWLPVDNAPKTPIDFTFARANKSFNDGYLFGLTTALSILEGACGLAETEDETAALSA